MNSCSQGPWEQGESKGSEVCLAHFSAGCIRGDGGFKVGSGSAGEQGSHESRCCGWAVLSCPLLWAPTPEEHERSSEGTMHSRNSSSVSATHSSAEIPRAS